jgi:OOP family OmpA-OmpF porin
MKLYWIILFVFSCSIIRAQNVTIESNRLVLKNKLVFITGTAKLDKTSDPALKNIKAFLESKTYISTLRIEGHVANMNGKLQQLSQDRAMAVAKALIKTGVDCKRLLAVGFGNSKPVADNSTPEGKMQNTRIVFEIAALRNIPVGGMPLDGGGVVAGDVCK